jgi:hypothetical protein
MHREIKSIGINVDVIYKRARVVKNSSGKLNSAKQTERGQERL